MLKRGVLDWYSHYYKVYKHVPLWVEGFHCLSLHIFRRDTVSRVEQFRNSKRRDVC